MPTPASPSECSSWATSRGTTEPAVFPLGCLRLHLDKGRCGRRRAGRGVGVKWWRDPPSGSAQFPQDSPGPLLRQAGLPPDGYIF